MRHALECPPCPGCFDYRGCRCDDCWREIRRYKKLWKVEHDSGRTRLVDAGPVREHVRMLLDYGMTGKGLARSAGVAASTVQDLIQPRSDGRMSQQVNRRTAEKLMSVRFDPRRSGMEVSIGTTRRLRDLALRGFSIAEVAEASGIHHDTLARARAGRRKHVRTEVHEAVLAAHARLHRETPTMTDTAQQGRVRRLAQKKGWVPIAAFDDAENPLERPKLGRKAS